MPARTVSTKRKRTSRREPEPSESDFSDIPSESDFSEEEFSEDEEVYDSESDIPSDSESEEDSPPPKRRRAVSKGKKATKTKTRSKSKKAAKTKTRSKSKKATKKKAKKATKSKSKKTGGLSEKRLKGRNIPIPMLSAVVEPPKDEQGNVIPPVKQDRKFLLVNENGTATTKAYTAKGPYQAALKAANRLDVTDPDGPTTEIRLREPNSQIMYVFDGKRTRLPKEQCIYFYCENNKRQKVSYEEKEKLLKKNPDAKIIPICHKGSVKRRERVKLNELVNDDAPVVEATA